ncbi:hypothetical protein [Bdellovibrio bacteriovorus]|uniref:hypothetical protein n=1 Tax=Bdellovibrio bacteriovorus TaxID=959 RepID=UPI00045BF412|nr:hypothetical protein [Bdellovibrio bacteriovorus]AHZ86730.1 hypothetical protein EP01_17570 [Bdellovibrio bacteriovorus]BEV67170.1 hypothetical protein Bb109J_c0590 [Bdellovibrio bacteriovorus]
MKPLMTFAMICLFSMNVFAASVFDWVKPDRPGDRPGYGRPQVSCSASDDGWEEHWSGHRDCRECLKKHGNCIETCSAKYYACTAEGVDYRGYRMTIESRGNTQYAAEREAIDRCHYRYSNCRITSCNEKNETVSRRSCR